MTGHAHVSVAHLGIIVATVIVYLFLARHLAALHADSPAAQGLAVVS